jgi:hypothetical protein
VPGDVHRLWAAPCATSCVRMCVSEPRKLRFLAAPRAAAISLTLHLFECLIHGVCFGSVLEGALRCLIYLAARLVSGRRDTPRNRDPLRLGPSIYSPPSMSPSTLAVIERALAITEKARRLLKNKLAKLNSRHRVLSELRRAAMRKDERVQVNLQRGRPKAAASKVGGPKCEKKRKAGGGRGVGLRWPGKCHACCKRFFGEPGGPGHVTGLCGPTRSRLRR